MARAIPADQLIDTASRRTLTLLIPAKNEAENIEWVLERLPPIVDEVVLVDAHSTDATIETARRVRPDVVVVSDNSRGKGDAIRIGVEAATGDDVVMIDADGSMDPAEIDAFVTKLRSGYDLVKGSRFLPGAGTADMTIVRDAGHRALLTFSNLLYGTSWSDLCYGFAAFKRDAFQSLELTADGFEIEAQLFLRTERVGLRVAEVPSFEAPRRTGTSNLNTFRDGWRVLTTIVAERLRAPRPGLAAPAGVSMERSMTSARSAQPRSTSRPARARRSHGEATGAHSPSLPRAMSARRPQGTRLSGSAAASRRADID